MCGIFGFVIHPDTKVTPSDIKQYTDLLFQFSESRGKEAAGMAIHHREGIRIYKQPLAYSKMKRLKDYKQEFQKLSPDTNTTALIAHSRLVTNGILGINQNNQPVVKNGIVGVHNGIIVNDNDIWKQNEDLKKTCDVDTEAFLSLLGKEISKNGELIEALSTTYKTIIGEATVGLLFNNRNYMMLATNNGSLHIAVSPHNKACFFASESYILEALGTNSSLKNKLGTLEIKHIQANCGCRIDYETVKPQIFHLDTGIIGQENPKLNETLNRVHVIINPNDQVIENRHNLKRCTQCILPETMPLITFNGDGVCNYCKNYYQVRIISKGVAALKDYVAPFKKTNGKSDCLVALSGGKDSCFMLHYVKQELGLNPVAYTYDWGMVTDLARRNASRMCGKLGVEHIVVSADIRKKRDNIQKNVKAWLHKPHLSMIPLFTAGDKQYFYYVSQLRKQTGLELIFWGRNHLERTEFKTGFSGIKQGKYGPYDMPFKQKFQLLAFYFGQYLRNPYYINQSMLDTGMSFFAAYYMSHDYICLFDYYPWNENEIMETLRKQYDWEVATDTKATWRIGDGTAAFYNYIYYTVAGFTEFDAFRSNQIRVGDITRDEALKMIEEDNQPRFDAMTEYAYTVGFNLDDAIIAINKMPKLYCQS